MIGERDALLNIFSVIFPLRSGVMPVEKFWNRFRVEGDKSDLEVAWFKFKNNQDYPYVVISTKDSDLDLDESGVDRLIKTLKRAKRQAFKR